MFPPAGDVVVLAIVVEEVECRLGEATPLVSAGLQHAALCREVGAGSHQEDEEGPVQGEPKAE